MVPFLLRKWKKEDARALAAAANNPRIAANLRNSFPCPYTYEDACWYIDDCLAGEGKRRISRAIEAEGKAVGSIGIFVQEDVYEKSAELGYWLSEAYWRRGIMTRAVEEIVREAFRTLDITRIYAEPFAQNAGSRGVLEKAGFTCEGTMRDGVYKNGTVYSYCMYSILRGETGL
jgi:ribosomal-protein-alanine N-acetyltransferase